MSLGVKNDSDLSFAWADLGAAAEGNSMRIRVLGLLITAAHTRANLASDNDSLCRRVKYPLGK